MTSTNTPASSGNPQILRWHPYSSVSNLELDAAQAIIQAAQQAIARSGLFTIVLAGGTTPRHVYALLTNMTTDWQKWHVYFGDERCLPSDSPDRNSTMAGTAWLNNVDIPADQIHIIPAELGAEQAAQSYSKLLGNVGQFDLVLLGLGEDGHTASLFPGHDAGCKPDSPPVLAVNDAPKPPSERVSLSAQRLSLSWQVIFLVTGDAKKTAINDWLKGRDIPASLIRPEEGVDIYIEKSLIENEGSTFIS